MTQQEMETIITELETTFKQPAQCRPWNFNSSQDFEFNRYEHSFPNQETASFDKYYGVGLWFKGVLVSTITSIDQWQAFKSVARLFCQVETIGTHTGQCIECERVSIVSDASHLCEACTLEAQMGNDGQWEFKPLA